VPTPTTTSSATRSSNRARTVAVGSGKGGVGKSLVAANVGIFLATLGKRVTLVDCAFGAPNLHLFAGVTRPLRSLCEFFDPSSGLTLADIAVNTAVPGLSLIGATFDPLTMAHPTPAMIDRVVSEAAGLNADYVVLDLGPGTGDSALEIFLAADIGVVVTVPDPTAIELTHRFVRAAFVKRLQHRGLAHLVSAITKSQRSLESGIPSALEIYLQAVADSSPDIDALRVAILEFSPHLAVNSARSKSDIEMGRALAVAARRRLGTPIQYLGHLEYDEAVWASTRRRRPLLIEHPETRIAKCFERLARGLLGVKPATNFAADDDVLPSDSHYELLDVPPTASFEDLRRANRRIRDIYGAESVVISGLYDPASLEAVHRRLDLAYTTLMDAAKRKEYDRQLFPDGVPMPIVPRPESAESAKLRLPQRPESVSRVDVSVRPPLPAIAADTEFSGPLLRQIREAQGIELRDIAERSKIGMAYLQAMEAEIWNKLPAVVYVRGFVAEYARVIAGALGLDAALIRESYLARYRAGRGLLPEDG
jgi:flagellar biosynthesis protein FlhG